MNKYVARLKSGLEMRTKPACFNYCVNDVETVDLTGFEKNCMRECYFKKQNARDDMWFTMLQMKYLNDITKYKVSEY